MLTTHLIEKALALTGGDINDVYVQIEYGGVEFSIEYFCYYILSPEFIKKYDEIYGNTQNYFDGPASFGRAIYYYQKKDEEPLISLLQKI